MPDQSFIRLLTKLGIDTSDWKSALKDIKSSLAGLHVDELKRASERKQQSSQEAAELKKKLDAERKAATELLELKNKNLDSLNRQRQAYLDIQAQSIRLKAQIDLEAISENTVLKKRQDIVAQTEIEMEALARLRYPTQEQLQLLQKISAEREKQLVLIEKARAEQAKRIPVPAGPQQSTLGTATQAEKIEASEVALNLRLRLATQEKLTTQQILAERREIINAVDKEIAALRIKDELDEQDKIRLRELLSLREQNVRAITLEEGRQARIVAQEERRAQIEASRKVRETAQAGRAEERQARVAAQEEKREQQETQRQAKALAADEARQAKLAVQEEKRAQRETERQQRQAEQLERRTPTPSVAAVSGTAEEIRIKVAHEEYVTTAQVVEERKKLVQAVDTEIATLRAKDTLTEREKEDLRTLTVIKEQQVSAITREEEVYNRLLQQDERRVQLLERQKQIEQQRAARMVVAQEDQQLVRLRGELSMLQAEGEKEVGIRGRIMEMLGLESSEANKKKKIEEEILAILNRQIAAIEAKTELDRADVSALNRLYAARSRAMMGGGGGGGRGGRGAEGFSREEGGFVRGLMGGGAFGTVAMGVLTAEMVGEGVRELGHHIKELVVESGDLEHLRDTMERLGSIRGTDTREFLEDMRKSTHDLVLDVPLMRLTNAAWQSDMKITNEQVLQLTHDVVALSRAQGHSAEEAVAALQRTMIGRGRAVGGAAFAQIGRITGVQPAEIMVQRLPGVILPQMVQRQEAFNKLIDVMHQKYLQAGEPILTAADRIKQLEVVWKRVQEGFAKGFVDSEGFTSFLKTLDDIIKRLGGAEDAGEKLGEKVGQAFGYVAPILNTVVTVAGQLYSVFMSVMDLVGDMAGSIAKVVNSLTGLGNTGQDVASKFHGVGNVLITLAEVVEVLASRLELLSKAAVAAVQDVTGFLNIDLLHPIDSTKKFWDASQARAKEFNKYLKDSNKDLTEFVARMEESRAALNAAPKPKQKPQQGPPPKEQEPEPDLAYLVRMNKLRMQLSVALAKEQLENAKQTLEGEKEANEAAYQSMGKTFSEYIAEKRRLRKEDLELTIKEAKAEHDAKVQEIGYEAQLAQIDAQRQLRSVQSEPEAENETPEQRTQRAERTQSLTNELRLVQSQFSIRKQIEDAKFKATSYRAGISAEREDAQLGIQLVKDHEAAVRKDVETERDLRKGALEEQKTLLEDDFKEGLVSAERYLEERKVQIEEEKQLTINTAYDTYQNSVKNEVNLAEFRQKSTLAQVTAQKELTKLLISEDDLRVKSIEQQYDRVRKVLETQASIAGKPAGAALVGSDQTNILERLQALNVAEITQLEQQLQHLNPQSKLYEEILESVSKLVEKQEQYNEELAKSRDMLTPFSNFLSKIAGTLRSFGGTGLPRIADALQHAAETGQAIGEFSTGVGAQLGVGQNIFKGIFQSGKAAFEALQQPAQATSRSLVDLTSAVDRNKQVYGTAAESVGRLATAAETAADRLSKITGPGQPQPAGAPAEVAPVAEKGNVIPQFETGGYVEKTGMAVVDEGEYILNRKDVTLLERLKQFKNLIMGRRLSSKEKQELSTLFEHRVNIDDIVRHPMKYVNESVSTVKQVVSPVVQFDQQKDIFPTLGAGPNTLVHQIIHTIHRDMEEVPEIKTTVGRTLSGVYDISSDAWNRVRDLGGQQVKHFWDIAVDAMPHFQYGGPVHQTGPAFLHAGEYVMNASGTDSIQSMMVALGKAIESLISPMNQLGGVVTKVVDTASKAAVGSQTSSIVSQITDSVTNKVTSIVGPKVDSIGAPDLGTMPSGDFPSKSPFDLGQQPVTTPFATKSNFDQSIFGQLKSATKGLADAFGGKGGGAVKAVTTFTQALGSAVGAVGGFLQSTTQATSATGGALGGALSGMQMGSMFGPWGMLGGAIAGGIFGGIMGSKNANAQKMLNEIKVDFNNLTTQLNEGLQGLNQSIQQMEQLRQKTSQVHTGKSSSLKQQKQQQLDQEDQTLQQLQEKQHQVMQEMQKNLDMLRVPQAYQDILGGLTQILDTYKKFAEAAQTTQQLAQAQEYLTRAVQQWADTQAQAVQQSEIDAINNAIQLNNLYVQRQQLMENFAKQEQQILSGGVKVREESASAQKAGQLRDLQTNFNLQMQQMNQEISLATYKLNSQKQIFQLASTQAGLETEVLQLQFQQIDRQTAQTAATENLINLIRSTPASALQTTPQILAALGLPYSGPTAAQVGPQVGTLTGTAPVYPTQSMYPNYPVYPTNPKNPPWVYGTTPTGPVAPTTLQMGPTTSPSAILYQPGVTPIGYRPGIPVSGQPVLGLSTPVAIGPRSVNEFNQPVGVYPSQQIVIPSVAAQTSIGSVWPSNTTNLYTAMANPGMTQQAGLALPATPVSTLLSTSNQALNSLVIPSPYTVAPQAPSIVTPSPYAVAPAAMPASDSGAAVAQARMTIEQQISSLVSTRVTLEMQVVSARKTLIDQEMQYIAALKSVMQGIATGNFRGLTTAITALKGTSAPNLSGDVPHPVQSTPTLESHLYKVYEERGRYGEGGFLGEYP